MNNEIVVKNSNIPALKEQFELIKKFKLPESILERYYIRKNVVKGKTTLTLIKREVPVRIYVDDEHNQSISATKSYSERIGLDSGKKGKYNDEGRLLFSNPDISPEVKEVEAFAKD